MRAFFRPQKEVTMYPTCASCTVQACAKGTTEGMPKNCPMRDPGFFEQTFPEYQKAENHDFYVTASGWAMGSGAASKRRWSCVRP